MNKTIKAVIFDLDGTLACTVDDLLSGVNHMLDVKFGFPPLTVEGLMKGINFPERQYIVKMLETSMEQTGQTFAITESLVDECVSIYTTYYGTHFLDSTHVYEGVTAVVDKMKAAGLPLAICTNKKTDQAAVIVENLIPDRFDAIVGDGMYPHKPDPTGALAIAAEFGVRPEECLFIGDSDVDMKTAKNAGMVAVGVSWGYRDEETLRRTGMDVYVTDAAGLLNLCGIE